MVKHNLTQSYFHGCGDCRDCCDGKLFSIGQVTFSDFHKIVRLFPTAFDIENKTFIFFYSLVPTVGCNYYRDGNCSIYNILDRPDTCLNYPFGIDENKVIHADYESCKHLNLTPNNFPVIIDGKINPRVMNEFFTEYQYTQNNNTLNRFIELVFRSNSLKPFPKFKTLNGEIIDIKELESNKSMRVIDIKKLAKVIKKEQKEEYNQFLYGHLMSLENLPQFGKRLLEQI